jgi:hypothetical protein
MVWKLASIINISLFASTAAVGQASFVTSNAFVMADVSNDGQGLVRYFYANGEGITFLAARTSFLTILVDTTYYTNNPDLNPNTFPVYPTMLKGGGTTKRGDTIETVWQPEGKNAFDIVQDIYPVAFPISGSGQIVFKISVRNHTDTVLNAQAQYLLDVCLTKDVNTGNDNAPITTRYGYISNEWISFPDSYPIPPYYIASLQSLSGGSFPSLMAIGYLNDLLAPEPMGLIQPSLFAYTDWREIVTEWTWGAPEVGVQYPTVGDEALLFQWTANSVAAGDSTELACGSYGTPPCTPICLGNALDAMLVHPDHIVWNGTEYVPNHFPVDGIVWNQTDTVGTSASGTQSITNDATGQASGPVQIISPQPTSHNGHTQQQSPINSMIQGGMSATLTWEDTVLASVLTNCSTDSIYDIAFSATASGLGASGCLNGTYSCPIMVDCTAEPPIAPTATVLSRTGSYDGSECNTRCTSAVTFDTGARRIPVLMVSADSLTNMRLSIAPNHAGADSTFYSVCVVDSLQNGSAAIRLTDSLGNSSVVQYTYCTIPDTLPPLVLRASPTGMDFSMWIELLDNRPWDRGLDSMQITSLINGMFDSIPTKARIQGLSRYQFSLTPIDQSKPESICFTVVDLAGNHTDTCFTFAVEDVQSVPTPVISLVINPNPTSGSSTILLSGAPSADVEIFDVLGREVDRFRVDGSYDWETGGLPNGTYIVRANANGPGNSQPITKRIVKE